MDFPSGDQAGSASEPAALGQRGVQRRRPRCRSCRSNPGLSGRLSEAQKVTVSAVGEDGRVVDAGMIGGQIAHEVAVNGHHLEPARSDLGLHCSTKMFSSAGLNDTWPGTSHPEGSRSNSARSPVPSTAMVRTSLAVLSM